MSEVEPATVGILTEPFLYEWQVRAIERLQDETDITVSLVVQNVADTECEAESWNTKQRLGLDDVTQFFEVFRQEKAWTLVLAERNIARLLGDEQTLWHRHSVENVDCLDETEHVQCVPETENGWNELPDGVVSRLEAECDVAVRFGFGLVRGDVLTAPKYGVLSFHPADIRRYRGMGPPAIFHDGRARAGSTLQRLNESIDGGEIVAYDDVSLADCHTLWDVFDRLATLQISLLTSGITSLRDPTFEPRTISDEQLGEFYYRDQRRTVSFSGRVLAKNLAGRVRHGLERARSSEETDRRSSPLSK
ncbi:formyltransferase family protein [Natronorubrum bangense]|uniref:Methionyl-tRNA formyltransferase-like protein n=2 Tax=Natronorubrum bangense TaxID=61858 RepID=L9WEZ5_9EURY|nr:formyltransferase family protein [Natronorubrum bangense]ELY47856.1 methionyl-tRNA formyltransferase-like protein [Natronorubrum bangense JCM 10635]QCC53672.1 methionyl-tRNA formyltransferase [Natronorubrum bangense]